jgi:hypothetical protein
MWGSAGIDQAVLKLYIRQARGQLHAPAALTLGKQLRHPLERRYVGTKGRSDTLEAGIEPHILGYAAPSVVSIPVLFHLLFLAYHQVLKIVIRLRTFLV